METNQLEFNFHSIIWIRILFRTVKQMRNSNSPPSKNPPPTRDVRLSVHAGVRHRERIRPRSGTSPATIAMDRWLFETKELTLSQKHSRISWKKTRKSRTSTSTSPFPHDRNRITLAIWEQTGSIALKGSSSSISNHYSSENWPLKWQRNASNGAAETCDPNTK